MRRNSKLLAVIFLSITPLLILQNGCSPSFKSFRVNDFSTIDLASSGGLAPLDPATVEKGKAVYAANCVACHSTIDNFNHPNSTAQKMKEAVMSRVPQMAYLASILKDEDYAALEQAVDNRPRTETPGTMTPIASQCTGQETFSKTKIRRLNVREYTNSVRDLFNNQNLTVSNYPQNSGVVGFDTDQDAIRTFSEDVPVLLSLAENVIGQVAGQTSSIVNSCTSVAACQSQLLAFVKRAYRKMPSAAEMNPLYKNIQDAASLPVGMRNALQSVLISPQFLFHMVNYGGVASGGVHSLNAFELASRLSFFLWSSVPDQELITLAENGQLLNKSVLSAQVKRLLLSTKSRAFIENFTMQWLDLPLLSNLTRSAFTPAVQAALPRETVALFSDAYTRSLPVDSLLTANYSFLNKAMADYYGVAFAGTDVNAFTAHTLPANLKRRGFLSQASMLSLSSSTDGTSPIKRGRFILDKILCDPPHDPPPGTLDQFQAINPNLPIRERLSVHRSTASCATCHKHMDPLGFGFEIFDPAGKYRTNYPANAVGTVYPVDSADQLPDGFKFNTSYEMVDWLTQGQKFEKCISRSISSYGLGRSLTKGDLCTSDKVVDLLNAKPNMSFGEMIENLVLSDFFSKSLIN